MKIEDLGEINAPVLLFGGPYSNLQATQSLLETAKKQGFGSRQLICTGDIVAYCGQPVETVAAIRTFGVTVVAGNCEKQLAENALDCGCGFEVGSQCDRLSMAWFSHAHAKIGADDRTWMRDLPDLITFTQNGLRCVVIHGGVRDISRFLWPTSSDTNFCEEIEYIQSVVGCVAVVISGHCGIAFERKVNGVTWLNAGAIGMPPNDGNTEVRYAVLSEGRSDIRLLSYDFESAIEAMTDAGLVQGYNDALRSGYWPSEEVLPPELRRAVLTSG